MQSMRGKNKHYYTNSSPSVFFPSIPLPFPSPRSFFSFPFTLKNALPSLFLHSFPSFSLKFTCLLFFFLLNVSLSFFFTPCHLVFLFSLLNLCPKLFPSHFSFLRHIFSFFTVFFTLKNLVGFSHFPYS